MVKAFNELINWYGLIDEGVVRCKDGSFIAGWYLEGIDTEPLGEEEKAARTQALARAVAEFRDEDGFWIEFARRPLRSYKSSEKDFEAAALQVFEAEREAFFRARDANYTNRITLCYHWKPPSGTAAVSHLLGRVTGQDSADQDQLLRDFAARCAMVESRLGAHYRMARMGLRTDLDDHHEIPMRRDALLGRLASSLSGRFCKINVPRIPVYLDHILAPEWVHRLPWHLPTLSARPLALIAVDGYPAQSSPEMLGLLEALPIEYQWTTRYLPLSPTSAKARIAARRRGWSFSRSSLRSQFNKDEEAAAVSQFADDMAQETTEALTGVEAGEMSFGTCTTVLTLFGNDDRSEPMLKSIAERIITELSQNGFSARRETLNALEAFLSTLPGHRAENLRAGLVNSQAFADLIPISTIWSGQPTNPSNKFPAGAPALIRALSATGEPYFFNLHSRDIGHSLIFGPTGSGKSVLLNLIASNFLKYPGAQVFVFDKMNSMYTLTRAIGGTHIDLGSDDVSLSPLSGLTDLGAAWAAEWVDKLCTLNKVTLAQDARTELGHALANLQGSTDALREFRAAVQVPAVQQVIAQYIDAGPFAGFIDAPSDTLDLSRFTVFEADRILEAGPHLSVPVLDYLFERIEHRLTGAPSLILIDEAWSFIGHPLFARRIEKWLRELRKANCALVLATQFTGDALDTGLSGPLIQSCKTRIFLPDPDAKNTRISQAYRDLDLSDAQIDILATMRPAQDYYIIKPEGRRIVDFCLGPKALSILGATDVDDTARAKTLWARNPDTWWHPIVERAAS
ncbi:helicase HerA domain-containing protein [Ruegeria sp.]|uniref:VirB4 family type IV secretion/conjugal transfer ATPase n=1 Tax=Ruegeria sp. TaxID=1879320 RepID=UPI003AFFA941